MSAEPKNTRCIAEDPMICQWASQGWCPRCEAAAASPPSPPREPAEPTPKARSISETLLRAMHAVSAPPAEKAPDGRVIFDPKTVSDLTAFLVQIEREVKWVRGLMVTEGDKTAARAHLRTPQMVETLAKLRAPLRSPATPPPRCVCGHLHIHDYCPANGCDCREFAPATAPTEPIRYEPIRNGMESHADGYWVRLHDYEKAATALASSQQEVERLKAELAAARSPLSAPGDTDG